MKIRHWQGLFVKAVIVLSVISLVPVLIIGYRMMQINSRLLQNELLQRQQTVAQRLASSVRNALLSKEQLLAEFGDLHTDFGNYTLVTESDLSSLRQRTPAFFYLAVFTAKERLIFDEGTQPQASFAQVKPEMLSTALQGIRFISDVYYDAQGKPFVWLAQPLHRQAGSNTVTGVLAAAMHLEDVLKSLLQIYPLDMDAFLVSASGQLLSYNGAPEELDTQHSAALLAEVNDVETKLAGKENGIVLWEGKQWLASVVSVRDVHWHVYLLQPAQAVAESFKYSLFHSFGWDIVIVVLAMFLFVVIASYWVIIPITRPLALLRNAAVKLREDKDYVVQQEDIEIPHNEIGEFAGVFVDMSHTLHQRQQELLGTQQKLAQMNQVLEQRVAERTRALQATAKELIKSERLAAIGQMASIISHEIRNPLAVISNATRLIKTLVKPTDSKLSKQFNIIEDEIKQANSIISEVLGYARSREQILTLVDVNSYVHEIVSSYPALPNISVVEKLDAESVRIKVDAEEIKQALRNIISNALEAMPTGGTLTVGTKVGKRVVQIFIEDSGVGIAPEIRKEIFAPFFTTKARGTGLGLAVVGKAISRHKGKLFIKSEVGKGSCFQIYLKIYRKIGDTNYGEAS